MVGVLVRVGVMVGVLVKVGEGVTVGITKAVKVGMGVEEGRRVGAPAFCSSWVAVQVGGMVLTRSVGAGVSEGMKRVGRRVGGGKGLSELLSSTMMSPYTPHRPRVDTIITMDRMSQIDNFTAIHPFCGDARLSDSVSNCV